MYGGFKTRWGPSEEMEVAIYGTSKRKAKRTYAKLKAKRKAKKKNKKTHR